MNIIYTLTLFVYCAYLVCREMGFRAYRINSVDDLSKPFISMYFGAAYLVWLVECEGR
jgi:hypothetical protein